MLFKLTFVVLTAAALGACASKTTAPSSSNATGQTDSKTAKAKDDIIGTILPGSKFAKLKIGMDMSQVQALIKMPDDMKRYESGKRWIPFYFGDDAQRMETYYEGEGCLTYTGGGVFGGVGGQLIRIHADKTKACFS
ncbi:hypothetical protein IMCC9480_54 [Oxalobacteraceae bacterium IMCC9480]|nr:hypothetical protein IMCC9480_54 [Oxalobacteraceae bacterium IMCC9480]NDP58993.1 hypothetical protein [Oxalobacteraceae bacterium]